MALLQHPAPRRIACLLTFVLVRSAAGAPPPSAWWATLPDLPDGAADVSVSRVTPSPVPEARWGWAASAFCGEEDLFRFKEPALSAHPKEGLRCGKALLSSARGDVFMLELDRPARSFFTPVYAVASSLRSLDELAALVAGFHREKAGGVEVLCRPFEPGARACRGEQDTALALVDGWVLGGKYPALVSLIRSPLRQALWVAMERTSAFFGDPRLDLAFDLQPKGTAWTIGPRRWLNFTREEGGPLSDAVRLDARAVAWEQAWEGGRGAITLVPRCRSKECPARGVLLDALRKYHTAWKASARQRLDALYDASPGDPTAACLRPLESAIVEAAKLAQPKVTPQGTVELRYAVGAAALKAARARRPKACATGQADEAAVKRVQALLGP